MTAPGSVARQLGISARLLTTTTLSDVTYLDAHVLETRHAGDRTAEQWARALLEGGTDGMRAKLTAAWASIGLQLIPTDPATVAGWKVVASTPEAIVLQANSSLGFQAELATTVTADGVEQATFVAGLDQQASGPWYQLVPAHLVFVRKLLEYTDAALSAAKP